MTNLSPYRLGSTCKFIEDNEEVIYVSRDSEGRTWFINSKGALDCSKPFKTELTGITLEFLRDLAKEHGDSFDYECNYKELEEFRDDSIQFYPNVDKKLESINLEKDPNETLGEFALRVAKLRNYLS